MVLCKFVPPIFPYAQEKELCRSNAEVLIWVRPALWGAFFILLKRRKTMDLNKIYEPPKIELFLPSRADVLTASGPNTDLGSDIGEWDSEM